MASTMASTMATDPLEKPARAEGLLRKRSSTSVYMGSWRYCILHGSRLRWYMSAELARQDRELRGEVWVRAVEPWDGHGALNTYPHAFAVRTSSGQLLLCSAPTPDAKREWLAALHTSVAQHDTKQSSDETDGGGAAAAHTHENRRIVPEDMLRHPSEVALAPPHADVESECARCAVRFGALLSRRHLCGSCAKPFCSRHCAHLVTLAHLGLRSARRCCYACARRQEFIAYLGALKRFLTTVALNFPDMDTVVRRPLQESAATASPHQLVLLERTLAKLRCAPMSLVKTVKILYQTRRKPLLFRAACERLPFYVENCIDRVENLWYQILHLFQCCDADAESSSVQLFYLRRYMRAICRRSPRIALQTIWHVQASVGDATGMHPHSLLSLLGFIYPHTSGSDDSLIRNSLRKTNGGGAGAASWSEFMLLQCPDHQRREILAALSIAYAQTEELIAREPDSMIARWLNATSVPEFKSSARELADSGFELCEFQSSILYDSLNGAPSSDGDGSGGSDWGPGAGGAEQIESLVFDQVQFVQALAAISERLRHVQPPEQRGQFLVGELTQLNSQLQQSALYPLCTASDDLFRVLRIPPTEGKVFSTKMRAPTLIFLETVPVHTGRRIGGSDDDVDDPLRPFLCSSLPRNSTFFESLAPPSLAILGDGSSRGSVDETSESSSDAILGGTATKARRDSHLSLYSSGDVEGRSDSEEGDANAVRGILNRSVVLPDEPTDPSQGDPTTAAAVDNAPRGFSLASSGSNKRHGVDNIVYDGKVYGESWEERKERIRRESPFGELPGWQLFSVIVKTNDDLRQEVFTMQLIKKFRSIFEYESLSLWLRTYRIVATGANIGLLETINDACSLDHLKKNFSGGNLFAYFKSVYGEPGSTEFETARGNFIDSMAAYSVVSYLLLVKDRHNGNILLSTEGHIIHIDFGFILGIAPGGMFSIEDAPFKLTVEMVEIMGGLDSQGFAKYRQLICEGFLALQKYHSEIAALLQTTGQNSPFPCFEAVKLAKVITDLRERLCVGLSRQQVGRRVDQLIRKSYNAWGTRQYDAFQLRSNNIFP